jgi:hypothetical protein
MKSLYRDIQFQRNPIESKISLQKTMPWITRTKRKMVWKIRQRSWGKGKLGLTKTRFHRITWKRWTIGWGRGWKIRSIDSTCSDFFCYVQTSQITFLSCCLTWWENSDITDGSLHEKLVH